MAKVLHDPVSLVDPVIVSESRFCKMIVNKDTGAEFERNLDPRCRWFQLYHEAKLNPDRFEVFMEEKPTTVMEVDGEKRSIYTQPELDGFSISKLQEIGRMYGVKGIRKTLLINDIIQAQVNLMSKASAEGKGK